MPRCDSCNKFVSLDTDDDPEVELDIDKEGNVSGTVRIVNTCLECSQEMAEAVFTVDVPAPDQVKEHLARKGEHSLAVELSASRTDWMENKDRKGRRITNSRFMKHMYGAEGSMTWECSCGHGGDGDTAWTYAEDWSDEIQASSMEPLV